MSQALGACVKWSYMTYPFIIKKWEEGERYVDNVKMFEFRNTLHFRNIVSFCI